MAEEEVMLVAIRMDAKGAIKDADVIDTKFEKLCKTLQKGKVLTEGMEKAQKKLNESIKQSTDTTVKSNVAFIGKFAAFEAITSSTNQLISAQYKRIDADLAAGKISQEEAEKRRFGQMMTDVA